MHPVLAYLLKMAACSALLLTYYWLALRNEKFHLWNRFYLLATLLLSITLPLFRLPLIAESQPAAVVTIVNALPWNATIAAPARQWTPASIAMLTAGLVSLVLLVQLIFSLVKVLRLYRQHGHTFVGHVNLVITQESSAPFSFFRWLFWRSDIDPDSHNGQRMLQHELAHINEKHSADKLFMQIILIVFWMNPLFWLIRKELYTIHEFLADRKAIGDYDGAAFAAMILEAAHTSNSPALTNPFFNSQLKRRLIMITTSHAPKYSYLRRITGLVVIIFTAILLIFSIEYTQAQKTPKPVPTEKAHALPDSINISIQSVSTKNGKKESLITYHMKDGRTLVMTTDEAKKKGYPLPPPPPTPPVPTATPAPAAAPAVPTPVAPVETPAPPAPPTPPVKQRVSVVNTVDASNVVTVTTTEKPLIIYADLEISQEQMNQIDPVKIEAINVLKGEDAIKAYGEKGKNGVIKITPKISQSISVNNETFNMRPVEAGDKNVSKVMIVKTDSYKENPLYVLDGKKITADEAGKILAEGVETMNVLKDKAATDKYGSAGKNGVIEITTKGAKGDKGEKGEKGDKGPK